MQGGIMPTTKDIREAVRAELDFDPLVDAADITVKNMTGDVALNGTVPNYPHHLEVVLPAGQYRDNAMLTTAANNALMANITVPDGVEATASDGNIWLTGTVSHGSERTAAESAVAGLIGVRGIRDDIEIRGNAEITADVTDLVQGALDRYSLIADDSDITVSGTDGPVTLAGHVRTWAEHDAVIDAAWMGAGVSAVRDDLFVTG